MSSAVAPGPRVYLTFEIESIQNRLFREPVVRQAAAGQGRALAPAIEVTFEVLM